MLEGWRKQNIYPWLLNSGLEVPSLLSFPVVCRSVWFLTRLLAALGRRCWWGDISGTGVKRKPLISIVSCFEERAGSNKYGIIRLSCKWQHVVDTGTWRYIKYLRERLSMFSLRNACCILLWHGPVFFIPQNEIICYTVPKYSTLAV